MNNPKISIIIPAHNAAKYLENCINSIIDNNYSNLEIIIIDDNSTDKTPAIIDELSRKHNNIISKRINSCGVSKARNVGMDMITGDYFMFVDADDKLLDSALSTLIEIAQETGADVTGCQFKTFSSEKEFTQKKILTKVSAKRFVDLSTKQHTQLDKNHHPIYKIFSPDEYFKNQVLHENSRCWSKLFLSHSLANLRFDESLSIGEDLIFIINCLSSAHLFVETEFEGYGYFINPEGAMRKSFEARYLDQIKSWEIVISESSKYDTASMISATKHYLMAIMLVAGKLAEANNLPIKKRLFYSDFCHSKLKRTLKNHIGKEAYKLLDFSYKIKCKLYYLSQRAYLFLYSFHKYK